MGGRVGFVDSAREKDKARAVAENYFTLLKRGRYHGLHHVNTTKTKIEAFILIFTVYLSPF